MRVCGYKDVGKGVGDKGISEGAGISVDEDV